VRTVTDPVARILISAIFVVSGIMKLTNFSATANMIGQRGIPFPAAATAIAILIELVGAAMIIVGWQTKLAAWIQLLYLIPVTLMYHNFWAAPPQIHDMQMMNFLKNVGIMGGLLVLATRGAGAAAADSSA